MMRPTILVATLALAAVGSLTTACNKGSQLEPAVESAAAGPNDIESGMPGVPPIRVEILAAGEGEVCGNGNNASVHYIGTLENGTQFDASRPNGLPFTFRVGSGTVIAGWDLVAAKMKQGDRWKVVIPWQLAYGEHASGPIPARANLVFDMELMKIERR